MDQVDSYTTHPFCADPSHSCRKGTRIAVERFVLPHCSKELPILRWGVTRVDLGEMKVALLVKVLAHVVGDFEISISIIQWRDAVAVWAFLLTMSEPLPLLELLGNLLEVLLTLGELL